jgi:signal transduction histidine kinase
LSESVAEVRRHLREFARSRDVTVDVENPLPPIEVNAAAIELCLTNYISNAIKYSDPAKTGRWVRVRARLVDPTDGGDRGDRGELVVEVVDNGLGIPPETRTHLFERFFRGHTHVHGEVEGMGLGLSIVRETVEDLGGRVWAGPSDSGVSVFAFAIPATRSGEPFGTPACQASPVSGDTRPSTPAR